MMGRAGRPQFDTTGKAVVLTAEEKKPFYFKFLYRPFPVESRLVGILQDHINAEICAGTIATRQDAVTFLTWTYFYRRLVKNPSFYGLLSTEPEEVAKFLSNVVDQAIDELELCSCIETTDNKTHPEQGTVKPTLLGRIASYYYLHFTTVALFHDELNPETTAWELLQIISETAEFDDFPVRHSEDELVEQMNSKVAHPLEDFGEETWNSAKTKVLLLFEAHMQRVTLPTTDFLSDSKSALDQSARIIQALIDISSTQGWLNTFKAAISVLQGLTQGIWNIPAESSDFDDDDDDDDKEKEEEVEVKMDRSMCSPLLMLPGINKTNVESIEKLLEMTSFADLLRTDRRSIVSKLTGFAHPRWTLERAQSFADTLDQFPQIKCSYKASHRPGKKAVGELVEISVIIEHTGGPAPSLSSLAYTPRFPKNKQDGWFLVLASPSSGTLHASRRVSLLSKRTTTKLSVPKTALEEAGGDLRLYVFSDSYVGLDQEIDISLS